MTAPRFSIVIPTRERAKYLGFALQTCLAQRFTDFEIIVADNCSSPATGETVARFSDERIRYLRSDEPLAMSENWDRAVATARGEYVTVLGDDDGLLLHALTDADAVIRATRTLALRWALMYYRWPDVPAALGPNFFFAPLQQGSQRRDGMTVIREVVAGRLHYAELPMIYCSFVSNEVLQAMRRRAGRVFCSMAPDIYSGFAIAAEAGQYVSMLRPAAIGATSARSNGDTMMRREKESDVARDFEDLNRKFGFLWHKRVPHVLRSLPAGIVESFEHVRDRYPLLNSVGISREQLVQRIIAERAAQADARNPAALTDAIQGVREWVRDEPGLRDWFEANLERLIASPPPPLETFRQPSLGSSVGSLVLDASEFGVTDTVAVAALYEKLVHAVDKPTPPPEDAPQFDWRAFARGVVPPLVLKHLRPLVLRAREMRLARKEGGPRP